MKWPTLEKKYLPVVLRAALLALAAGTGDAVEVNEALGTALGLLLTLFGS